MNGLALITDMEYIKVGNKDFMPDGRKLSSRHLVLTEGLSPCECSMLRQKREKNGTGICHVMQGKESKPVPMIP